MSHITHINTQEVRGTYHIWMSHVVKIKWFMSHIWMSHVTHMNESCHTHECAESAMAGTRQEQFTFTLASTISNSYVHITHLSAPFFVVHFYTHFYNFKFVCDIHVTFKIREQFWYKLLISLGSSSPYSKDNKQDQQEKSEGNIFFWSGGLEIWRRIIYFVHRISQSQLLTMGQTDAISALPQTCTRRLLS